MSSDLNEALKQFEAVEANLSKLDRLWSQIQQMLPSSDTDFGVKDDAAYRKLARSFSHIVAKMPMIDGFKLKDAVLDPGVILSCGIEISELGDIQATFAWLDQLREQGELLAEYRFRLGVKRRELARQLVDGLCEAVDRELQKLKKNTEGHAPDQMILLSDWEPVMQSLKSIDALLGGSLDRPARWGELLNRSETASKRDLDDIVCREWPLARGELERSLYGEDDPLPTSVDDIGVLVASKPTGAVTIALQWGKLTDAGFERLIFNLIDRTAGYENPEWLMHTNAPDRGRDLAVYRVQHDPLASSRRIRVIIACKHTPSVGIGDVTRLKDQMALWEPPRVDELVIATSGRFSTDAVQWVEKHNQSNNALRIEMWPESHLERLLAERPELIAEFQLR